MKGAVSLQAIQTLKRLSHTLQNFKTSNGWQQYAAELVQFRGLCYETEDSMLIPSPLRSAMHSAITMMCEILEVLNFFSERMQSKHNDPPWHYMFSIRIDTTRIASCFADFATLWIAETFALANGVEHPVGFPGALGSYYEALKQSIESCKRYQEIFEEHMPPYLDRSTTFATYG
ncbi:hypothetical protein KCU78_g1272, partial [Aureobasidium melanogenum]